MATKKRNYKKVSCHKTKTAATKKAKSMRNGGKTASVRKTADGYCIYSAGKRRKVTLKTGQKLSGTRRKKRRS